MKLFSLLLLAPPILIALAFHEFAHAFSGRLTLNPLRHLDPLGTIMIFLVHFGWAKPVPVNPSRLRNPKKDMLWISAAGPLSNMILALISGVVLRIFYSVFGEPGQHSIIGIFEFMLVMSLQINLALAIFNVLPIAPLDGSKILSGLLPIRYKTTIYFFSAISLPEFEVRESHNQFVSCIFRNLLNFGF
jgi:Zn-dependent protease